MNKKILLLAAIALLLATPSVMAADPASPPGCNADNSVVNIARSTASAQPGQTITFTVSAGNPSSSDGCDITNRTLTLKLPDGTEHTFGPNNYPNPTETSFVGSADYVASTADLVGGAWTATVIWNGTLNDGFDSPSNGNKAVSVNYEQVNLSVSKNVYPHIEQNYVWTIDKSVTPDAWVLFDGDSGQSQYTITVTKTLGSTTYSVIGQITITNPAQYASAQITNVTDEISGFGAATVNCPVTFPYSLPAGQTLTCTYSATLPDSTTRTNTATVTTTGDVGGNSASKEINFSGVSPRPSNSSIEVTDTQGGPWLFNNSGSVTYNKTFDCSGITYSNNHGSKTINNTATITQTRQQDSASVTVDCYKLSIAKTASTGFTRKYNWTIDKKADKTELTLAPGETYILNYEVKVDKTHTDSGWSVSGNITVSNPATIPATINSVTDAISGVGAATVNCPETFPYSLPAGQTLTCTYSATLPDSTTRTNTATATQQNYSHPFNGSPTPSGTTDYSGTANITFGSPTTETDECIEVTDTLKGTLGSVCAGQAPKTFKYTWTIGPYSDPEGCGEHKIDNTAEFITNDTETKGEDSWSVLVNVECIQGCTLTQGYWKTHSEFGKAPYDDTWALLAPTGASTPFYLSGQTWYKVFWTPVKGNVYYQLAHQFMAARLNILNGADAPASVSEAIAKADTWFSTYTPAQIGALKANDSLRKQFTSTASLLASYNEGYIGPGHCDEDKTSSP
ncbi:MAG: hypothetical protein QXK06_02170 [Candidatus Diapherotrites archaeon]